MLGAEEKEIPFVDHALGEGALSAPG